MAQEWKALSIQLLSPDEYASACPRLGQILAACVQGGASVGFLTPFHAADGEAFFRSLQPAIDAEARLVFGAYAEGQLAATVQMILNMPPNQPHRAEIAKMLVHPSFRGRGIAKALLAALEMEARVRGKSLLVMDTVRGEAADSLYRQCGYQICGVIPNYALYPDGRFCDTVVFFKQL
jgi:GNAT superfamily N-acetyltransferase